MANPWNVLSTLSPSVTYQNIITDTAPNISLTGTTSATLMWAGTVPGTMFQANDVLQVDIIWSCNNSANQKQIALNWYGTTTVIDSQTSKYGAMDTWYILPNGHVINSQNNYGTAYPGPLTAANVVSGIPTNADSFFGLYGVLANSADNLSFSFIRIGVWQDRTSYPTLFAGSGKKLFYGANGHWDESQTPANVVTSMNVLGCTLGRFTWEGSQASLTSLISIAQTLQAAGLYMYCCLDLDLINNGSALLPNEQAAYNYGFYAGMQVASALLPYGVQLFECGNELDTKNNINPGVTAGSNYSDFNGTLNGQPVWPILRGAMRGAIDGVHAAGQAAGITAYAGSNAFTICATACSDMLWYGWQPDGTSGHQTVRWDFTAWHNYRVYNSLFANPANASSNQWTNVLEHNWRNYGVPQFVSEFNGNSGDTDAQRAAYVAQEFPRFFSHRKQFGLIGVMVYSLYSDPPFNFMSSPTTPVSTLGTTYQSFISANPDPGL